MLTRLSKLRGAGRLGRLRLPHPVWALNAVIAGAAVALLVGPVAGYDSLVDQRLPWFILAIAYAITERWPVNLEFRRSAHSFSLSDVPLSLALVFTTGPQAVLVVAVGGAAALLLRRLPPIKFAFNLAVFVLVTEIGLLIAHLVMGDSQEFGPTLWVAVFAATQAGGFLTIFLLAAVIRLADGQLTRDQMRQMLGMDALVTATNTSFALLLALTVVEHPAAAPMIVIPMFAAFYGYRRYVAERQRHEKLEFLYEANRTLSSSPEISDAIEGLFERALEAFRAEQAEIVLFPADSETGVRTSLGPGQASERMVVVDAADVAALRSLPTRLGPVQLQAPFDDQLASYLERRGIETAMAAELMGEDRTIGVLLLANRLGMTKSFTADDLALFDTMSINASAALQFDRLEHAVSELRSLQQRLHHQAFHDPLTDLPNRSLLARRVQEALTGGSEVGVLFIDLDDFKPVNDTFGHAAGDQLLRGVAARLQRSVRDGDFVARLGGDEFAVLVTRAAGIDRAAVEVATRILDAFGVPVTAGDELLSVKLSLGVATTEHSPRSADDLLRDADVAMYDAKQTGKGRFATFDPGMRSALLRRHALREALEGALERQELVVQYQPIFDIRTQQLVAAEALVRWDDPARGRVNPCEFIPLAEETGVVVPLGRFVLQAACRAAAAYVPPPPDPLPAVHVNLSAVELEDDGLIENVRATLEASGLAPERLVLEITETLLVRDAERGARAIDGLRELGVRLALDDFGTGYSSLSYLRSLPISVLKIAKAFVDHIAESEGDAAFIRLILELAWLSDLTVVAEGIETPEQLAVLRKLNCDAGQGFLYSPPRDTIGTHDGTPSATAVSARHATASNVRPANA